MEKITLLLYALEASFFYVVAVLLLPGIFSGKEVKNRTVSNLIIVAFLFFLGWRIWILQDNPVSRYFIFTAILATVFLPSAVEWIARMMKKILPFLKIPTRALMLILTVIFVSITTAKEMRSWGHTKQFIADFSAYLRNDGDDGGKIYGIAFDTWRIAALSKMDGEKFQSYEDLIYKMQLEPNGVKYLLSVHFNGEVASEFKEKFRRFFYVFPFDFIIEGSYKDEHYILWKYNGKAGDGESDAESTVVRMFETPAKWSPKVPELNFSGIFRNSQQRNGSSVELRAPQFSYFFEDKCIFSRMPEYVGEWKCLLIERNQLLWPSRIFKVNLSVMKNESGEEPKPGDAIPDYASQEISMEPPLVLQPEFVLSSETYPENFIALNHLTKRFSFNGAMVVDNVNGKETALNIHKKIITEKLREPLKIKLIEDIHTVDFELKKHLESSQITVAEPSIFDFGILGGFGEKSPNDYLTNKVDKMEADTDVNVVVLNLGLHEILSRHYEIAFTPEKLLNAATKLIELCSQKYPGSRVILLIPPAPAPGECRFMANGNSKRAGLSRFAYASALLKKFPKISVFTGDLDPKSDYSKWSSDIYEAPFALSESGKMKLAENVKKFLIYLNDNQSNKLEN